MSPSRPFVEMDLPNSVWAADYKGQFRLSNGNCYPLTVTDGYSRFLLGCRSLGSTHFQTAQNEFIKLFKRYGLPDAILTDNGTPFASTAIAGLPQTHTAPVNREVRIHRISNCRHRSISNTRAPYNSRRCAHSDCPDRRSIVPRHRDQE